jgi:chaperonin GroES
MKLKPMGDKIVIKPINRVKSSIIEVVMDEVDNTGTVVAVGPGGWDSTGTKREYMPLKGGELVRFGTMGDDEYLKYTPYIEDGEKYLIMSWKDVCFIEEKESA